MDRKPKATKPLNAAFLARLAQRSDAGVRIVQVQGPDGRWRTLSSHDDFPEALKSMVEEIARDNTRSYRVRKKENANER